MSALYTINYRCSYCIEIKQTSSVTSNYLLDCYMFNLYESTDEINQLINLR